MAYVFYEHIGSAATLPPHSVTVTLTDNTKIKEFVKDVRQKLQASDVHWINAASSRKTRRGIYQMLSHDTLIYAVVHFKPLMDSNLNLDEYISYQPPRLQVDADMVDVDTETYFNKLYYNNVDDLIHDVIALRPEFERLRQSHDTPHHRESIDQHINMTIANAPSTKLALVAQFHDLGKGLTKRYDENGVAHYKYHERLGALYATVALANFGLNYQDAEPIIETVFQHMVKLSENGFTPNMIARNRLSRSDLQLISDFAKIDDESRF